MVIMVCSKCGHQIAVIDAAAQTRGVTFDTADTAWKCSGCEHIFFSSDGWATIDKLVVPYSEESECSIKRHSRTQRTKR